MNEADHEVLREHFITSPPPSPGRRGSEKDSLSLRERVRVRG
jgi:hypothetical protein